MNVKLEERNRELEAEIGERKRAESALQQSKKALSPSFQRSAGHAAEFAKPVK